MFTLSDLLCLTASASKLLQGIQNDLNFAKDCFKDIINVMVNRRSNSDIHFKTIFEESKKLMEKLDVELKLPCITKHQIHRSNTLSVSIEVYFRISVYNSLYDHVKICGEEYGSDHFLVVGKLKKAKKRKEEQTELFDIQKLCDLKTCEDFCKNISNEFKNEHIDNENDDIKSVWSAIRNVIRKATKKTVGKRRYTRNPWFNQICENALQRRKQARKVWLKDINLPNLT